MSKNGKIYPPFVVPPQGKADYVWWVRVRFAELSPETQKIMAKSLGTTVHEWLFAENGG
jgi:hypothetical protein